MNLNQIGMLSKLAQSSLESGTTKKTLPDQETSTTTSNTPSSKTYLTESAKQPKLSDPYQELENFMKMSDAEKMQYLWLKKHGISQEEFDAMSGEDKQKLMEQMQAEIKQQMQKAAESPDKTAIDIAG
ncbi:hypothetical protein SAMN05192566_2251 [Methylophilus rhizosphaerae]|uniref:Uncharacterized protein n=2 Tax=Methylophilus rhizosphaerae TaxID=492660 RepID=A0A1G9E9S1_9PROT|nr:hypothetical protein SAMN05192566_2251 [Methylophilus rhizosphaerae]